MIIVVLPVSKVIMPKNVVVCNLEAKIIFPVDRGLTVFFIKGSHLKNSNLT